MQSILDLIIFYYVVLLSSTIHIICFYEWKDKSHILNLMHKLEYWIIFKWRNDGKTIWVW